MCTTFCHTYPASLLGAPFTPLFHIEAPPLQPRDGQGGLHVLPHQPHEGAQVRGPRAGHRDGEAEEHLPLPRERRGVHEDHAAIPRRRAALPRHPPLGITVRAHSCLEGLRRLRVQELLRRRAGQGSGPGAAAARVLRVEQRAPA